MACTDSRRDIVDRLNSSSYAYHYRSIDSTAFYAREALANSCGYRSGEAEALNNLAFVSIAKMNYGMATRQLDSVFSVTDNQLELLVADVQYMRLCQRMAKNKDFYDYMERARQRMKRIAEDSGSLDERMRKRLVYAETEFNFVASTYFYYVGLDGQSRSSLDRISQDGLMQKDTAQYLNWLYQYGSGGMIKGGTRAAALSKEYDMLLECYLMAKKMGYRYWEANALQALSEHFVYPPDRDFLLRSNPVSVRYLNEDNMPDSLLAGYLAQKSMRIFRDYGDVYQIAGSIRTLAQCFWEIGDYRSSILWLREIFSTLPQIKQAPDLVASIREQMSIVYSSMNDKYDSDINRNVYLDMQERTRQDMELDARAAKLDRTASELNVMILVIILLIILFIVLIVALLRRESKKKLDTADLSEALKKCKQSNSLQESELADDIEEQRESVEMLTVSIDKNTRRNIDNRSKAFLVDSVMPLIDRMINEVDKLRERSEQDGVRRMRYDYIGELSEKIDEYNDVLTHWIQLRQGEIGIRIESFPLNGLFDMLSKSKAVFSMQGLNLHVEPTALTVKADRILTLFMINTLADNARKFTPRGGRVCVSAADAGKFVDISVEDNGEGMGPEQLATVFTRTVANGHGFGLMNCRGILNKYRKVSKLFDGCDIHAESEPGKGSRFWFRLPKGAARAMAVAFLLAGNALAFHSPSARADSMSREVKAGSSLVQARIYADSAYASNVKGDYENTLSYADSAFSCLNAHHLSVAPGNRLLMRMTDDKGAIAPEIVWYRRRQKSDYSVILQLRNEAAVAALALHEWGVYRYNNAAYTKLFKEVSSDSSLAEYCRIMQRSEINKNIAVAILVILLVALLAVGYMAYYRRAIKKHSIEELKHELMSILLSDDTAEEKLQKVEKLSENKYSGAYLDILFTAKEMLKLSSERSRAMAGELSELRDEVKRLTFQNDRLYVSNNIMENCLSTIKHETMYYPSRIHHCISGEEAVHDDAENMKNVADLLRYYKELYAMLCEQLHRQLADIHLKCRATDISRHVAAPAIPVYGDGMLYDYMFFLLRRENGGVSPACSMCAAGNGYAAVDVAMDNAAMPPEEVSAIFLPYPRHIPYLICRQIVREISGATNRCGCGITASLSGEGRLRLVIILPQAPGGHDGGTVNSDNA